MAKGWLDNYGKQENYNDSKTSVPEGFVGEGYSMKGRNYSPAWGGQFQDGGAIYVSSKNDPRYKAYQDSLSLYNNSENWLKKIPVQDVQPLSKDMKEEWAYSKIKPIGQKKDKQTNYKGETIYPVFKKPKQQVKVKPKPITPVANNLKPAGLVSDDLEIDSTNLPELRPQVRPVKDWKYIWKHAGSKEQGYVTSPEDMDYWVDKKDWYTTGGGKDKGDSVEIIPQYQMGGSIPGAVGFSYARTQSPAPSNGKYAKKTKASAQDGAKLDMHGSPITAIEKHRYDIDRSYYNPRTNQMILGADYAASDNKDKMIAHENYHAKQHSEGRDNFDIGHDTENRQWAEMQKRPQMMSTPEVWNNFYNRKGIESDMAISRITERLPESQFFRDAAGDIIYNKIVDPIQYDIPYSFEGEAQFYENTGKEFKNGGWLNKYDVAQDGKWLGNKLNKQGYITSETKGGNRISFTGNQRADEWINKQIDSGKFGFDPKTGGTFPLKKPVKGLSKEDKFIGTKQYYDLQAPQGFNTEDQLAQIEKLPKWQQEVINDSNESRRKNYIEGNMEEVVKHPLWSPGYFTPEGALIGAMQGATKMGPDLYEGNYKAAAMDALMMLPLAPSVIKTATPLIQKAGKALGTEEGLLSNTWKLNPRAYQYNLPENTMWRGLGKQGMEDAVSSGLFRSKQNVAAEFFPGSTLRMDKSFGTNPYFTPKFETASTYGDNFLAEVPRDAANWRNRYARTDWSQVADKPIPIDEGRLLQKDWWQGYKPIETSTPSIVDINNSGSIQRQGFPNLLGTVDSVIPRPPYPGMLLGMEGSWNNLSPFNLIPGYGNKLSAASEIYHPSRYTSSGRRQVLENILEQHPNSPPVGFRKFGNSIQDVIESQSLRPKGTGMGSKQIMSEGNWAQPGGVNENYSGVFEATMNPNVRNSNIKLEQWNKRNGVVGTTNEGDVAIPLTDPGLSFNRRLPFSNRYVPIDKEKLINNQFQLSTQLPHLQSLVEKYGLWAGGAGAAGYFTGGSEGAKENINTLNKYTIDPLIDFTKPYYNKAEEEFIRQTGNKKDGGVIKDDRGQWDHPGEITEINSNDITMEGVPYDVLGISDEGDVQLMKPGKNYKFKGKKVTEFPMAKNGLRQEQKSLQNLDNLTNFTNYNKPQPGGWLNKYN